jgi:hypothetical protein
MIITKIIVIIEHKEDGPSEKQINSTEMMGGWTPRALHSTTHCTMPRSHSSHTLIHPDGSMIETLGTVTHLRAVILLVFMVDQWPVMDSRQ